MIPALRNGAPFGRAAGWLARNHDLAAMAACLAIFVGTFAAIYLQTGRI